MAWYAYCIAEKGSFPQLERHRKPVPLEDVSGIHGNQVFLYPASDVAVLVSEHSPLEQLDQKAGVDHARVIADCFRHSTVLPLRFGTVFHSDEGLRRSVRSNQRQFLSNLEKLRGKAEMHLRIHLDDCCTEKAMPVLVESVGKEYLSSLRHNAAQQRERQTRARAISFQMQRMFSPLDQEVSCRRLDGSRMVLEISHLIERRSVERYQNKFAQALLLMKDCQLQLCGPRPPYHFVHHLTRGTHAAAPVAARVAVPA